MNKIQAKDNYKRLDVFLEKNLDISRSKAKKLIESNNVLLNGNKSKASASVACDDIIEYEIVEESMNLDPVKMDLDIIYEDDFLLVVNKPKKLVVHPAPSVKEPTLVNGLLYHFKTLSNANTIRPGIVHRIDADTTGLLVIAKDDKTHDFLSRQIASKTAKRKYLALVHGVILNDTGTIDAPIGRDIHDRKKMSIISTGKNAVTEFRVIKRYDKATLVEVSLKTGRTHQIRVHFNYIKHPIVNDKVYCKRTTIDDTNQCLHAFKLRIIHPNGKEMSFEAKPPKSFNNIIEKFE